MKRPLNTLWPATLLVADGVATGFAGSVISDLLDLPGAQWIGIALFMANLAAAAFFAMGRGTMGGLKKVASALILAADAVLLAAGGLYIGQADDAPGAALIGFVLLLANLATAVLVLRKRKTN